tara:strand:+ start:11631 stop:12710 length:1080 start_codon:yes stop_codon:yes gene_type:complete
MISKYKNFYFKFLYIFFVFLSLNIFFFSTIKVEAKAFKIDNIEISQPFEINFDKRKVIDKGFKKAFSELMLFIINSSDQNKIKQTKLNEIKGMIDTFSIKQEKFIDEVYYVKLGVTFNKKKVFHFLESKNIFPSIPVKKKILFIPIVIDENRRDLLVFSNNKIFDNWNIVQESFHLIDYILPTEDLEDLNLIKSKFEFIEKYDFKEIITKYNLSDSIIALIFKNEKEIRILSRISISNNEILKNLSFSNINIEDKGGIEEIIKQLKIVYEDYWKNFNQINTSIKLALNVKILSSNTSKISNFEQILTETDLIYDYYISKFDKDFIYYQIIFNGTPSNFLKSMKDRNYDFDTQNKIWMLK